MWEIKPPVRRDAVGDGRHAEFAHAVGNVVAPPCLAEMAFVPLQLVRFDPVNRPSRRLTPRQHRSQTLDGNLRGLARRHGLGFSLTLLNSAPTVRLKPMATHRPCGA